MYYQLILKQVQHDIHVYFCHQNYGITDIEKSRKVYLAATSYEYVNKCLL